MSLTTQQEVLGFWAEHETEEAKAERAEIGFLKQDIYTSQQLIRDAVARYRKDKLKARSKSKANSKDVFSELDAYESEEAIHTAYGWDFISRSEMDRLMHLWHMREESTKKAGIYNDRVIEMLDRAMDFISEKYGDRVKEHERKEAELRQKASQVAQENWENDHKGGKL